MTVDDSVQVSGLVTVNDRAVRGIHWNAALSCCCHAFCGACSDHNCHIKLLDKSRSFQNNLNLVKCASSAHQFDRAT